MGLMLVAYLNNQKVVASINYFVVFANSIMKSTLPADPLDNTKQNSTTLDHIVH